MLIIIFFNYSMFLFGTLFSVYKKQSNKNRKSTVENQSEMTIYTFSNKSKLKKLSPVQKGGTRFNTYDKS